MEDSRILESAGKPERLGGDPRNNADDAYATFLDMPGPEWQRLLLSMLSGGAFQPAEQEGFERALRERARGPQGAAREQ